MKPDQLAAESTLPSTVKVLCTCKEGFHSLERWLLRLTVGVT